MIARSAVNFWRCHSAAAEFVQPRDAFARADVFADEMGLVDRHVQPRFVGVLDREDFLALASS